jgi:dTDP-4-dehydrorhamnose 3,5-epimerase-like enzyme
MKNKSFINNTINNIKIIKSLDFQEKNGSISIFDNLNLSIKKNIKRMFFVKANKNDSRGSHAHINCTQIIFIINGKINLHLFDGKNKKLIKMGKQNIGVILPNGIWADQIYLEDNTIISVLCDYAYDENEYIRDKKEYIKLKNDQ